MKETAKALLPEEGPGRGGHELQGHRRRAPPPIKKIDVPADWANAVDTKEPKQLKGKPELVKMVKDILEPVGKMDGDSLPVSAFVDHVDGQFELGAAAYEKRGVAVIRPHLGRRASASSATSAPMSAPTPPSVPSRSPRTRPPRPPRLPRSWTSRPARARAPISSPWPSARWTAWAAASASAPAR